MYSVVADREQKYACIYELKYLCPHKHIHEELKYVYNELKYVCNTIRNHFTVFNNGTCYCILKTSSTKEYLEMTPIRDIFGHMHMHCSVSV